MNANRNIWQFICAAIVLIAVQFAPALARAHADQAHSHVHVHHAALHDSIVADAPVTHSCANSAFAETVASVQHAPLLTVGQTPGSAPIDSDGCVNGCCGAGMGCCGAAALASATPYLHPAVHSHRLDFAGTLLASGIEPASLRKPPRPLA